MIYTLFGVSASILAVASALIKIYRIRIENECIKDNVYYVLMIAVALILYGALARFDLRVNLCTLIFSAVYAALSYLSVKFNMRAIENADLVTISVFLSAGTILWNTLWGAILFNEVLTLKRIAGIVFVLIAVTIPYFVERSKRNSNMKGILYCFSMFVISGIGSVLIKLFSVTEEVMSENVFCFYTNVILIPLILLMLKKSTSVREFCREVAGIDKKIILILVIALALGNVNTLLTMFLIGKVDLVIYSIVEKSLGILMTAIVSWVIFKEKMDLSKIISSLFLISAIAVSVI